MCRRNENQALPENKVQATMNTLNTAETTVIIGAGHAGVQAGASLREYGWKGRIILISDEYSLPYERPPLSKTFDASQAVVQLRPQAFYDDKGIELALGQAVTSLEATNKTICLANGQTIRYDNAILCTGSTPMRVPPFDHLNTDDVYVLRNADDQTALQTKIEAGRLQRLLVLGAGFIGLEAAAALADRVPEITVVDLAPTAMGRAVAPEIGQLCVEALQGAGITIKLKTQIENVEQTSTGLNLEFPDRESLEVDGVLLSVGARPNDDLLVAAGFGKHREIAVNSACQLLGQDDLYAVGDMVMAPHPLLGETPMRLESVDAAVSQAKTAAAAICNVPAPRPLAPWFWSTQGKNKLQMVGIKNFATQWVLRHDKNAEMPTATALGFNDKQELVAAQCLNNTKDFAASRKFWGRQPSLNIKALTDSKLALKEAFEV